MTVCVHLCRGNYAQGMADGGYEPIAERMFDQLDVDGYFLEYDTPRAGDFSPLRHLRGFLQSSCAEWQRRRRPRRRRWQSPPALRRPWF